MESIGFGRYIDQYCDGQNGYYDDSPDHGLLLWILKSPGIVSGKALFYPSVMRRHEWPPFPVFALHVRGQHALIVAFDLDYVPLLD